MQKEAQLPTSIKTSLKLLSFLLAAGLPCAAFAELLGARIPSSLGLENAAGLFAVISLSLLLVSDYSRRSRVRSFSAAPAAALARKSTAETHRLAA